MVEGYRGTAAATAGDDAVATGVAAAATPLPEGVRAAIRDLDEFLAQNTF